MLNNQNIVIILGLGLEGLSSYKFLRENYPDKTIILLDEKPLNELDDKWQIISKNNPKIEFVTSLKDSQKLKSVGSEDANGDISSNQNNVGKNKVIVIKSPGLSPNNSLVRQTSKFEITSNTNIFFKLVNNLQSESSNSSRINIKIIGVTGTKGKSTTASMIHHVLKSCNIKSFLGGNIGVPPLDLWGEIKEATANNAVNSTSNQLDRNQPDQNHSIFVVLELSSHQLNDLIFSPFIAVILDISPEHLDYYDSFEKYVEAKSQISRFQTGSDLVIFNKSQKLPTKLANLGKAEQVTFGLEKNVVDNSIVVDNEKIIKITELPVIGKHNILNSIPSIIIAKKLGCSISNIKNALKTFVSLPHRLEVVSNHDGVIYINDSLSTTPESTITAIKSFNSSPIILIAGGYERNLNFDHLAETIINENIKHLILLPDTGEKIFEAVKIRQKTIGLESTTSINSQNNHVFAKNMKEAVEIAKLVAKPGDIVLLSPAAASFGHFKDYKDRGEQFKKFSNSY